jgi:rhodanese-related sulfurtransferase
MQIHSVALKGIARNCYAISDGKWYCLIDPGLAASDADNVTEGELAAIFLTSIPAERISAHRLMEANANNVRTDFPKKKASSGWEKLEWKGSGAVSALNLKSGERILRLDGKGGATEAYFTGTCDPELLEHTSDLNRDHIPVYSSFGVYDNLNDWTQRFNPEAACPSEFVLAYNEGKADYSAAYPAILPSLDAGAVESLRSDGCMLLDMRQGMAFTEGHVPGSLNLATGAAFLRHIHRIVDPDRRFLVISDAGNLDDCMAALAEAGLNGAAGVWIFDAAEWTGAGRPLDMLVWLDEEELDLDMRFSTPQLIDTRCTASFNRAYLANAVSVPPEAFDDEDAIPAGDHDLYLYCHDGGNSFLLASILKARGQHRVRVLLGGLQAAPSLWQNGPVPQATISNPN